jgi:hypothetical protein
LAKVWQGLRARKWGRERNEEEETAEEWGRKVIKRRKVVKFWFKIKLKFDEG